MSDGITERAFREMVATFVYGDDDRARNLAHECGVSRTTVQRWAAGNAVPHVLMREPVAAAIRKLESR